MATGRTVSVSRVAQVEAECSYFYVFFFKQKTAYEMPKRLEFRRVLFRSQAVVVKRLGVDEAEAYRRLQRLASTRNYRLAVVAGAVLESDGVFRAAEDMRAAPA